MSHAIEAEIIPLPTSPEMEAAGKLAAETRDALETWMAAWGAVIVDVSMVDLQGPDSEGHPGRHVWRLWSGQRCHGEFVVVFDEVNAAVSIERADWPKSYVPPAV